MTQIKVDTIADAAGTGAPDFADGITVSGSAIDTSTVPQYYSSSTQPSSPNNGAIWCNTSSSMAFIYVDAEFKELVLV